ncbi:MAG: helix-hairpin-helix domain-containing protein [Campylobacterota bacterium]|nr:helix-hairpin-helix domain-containing protein [Campylobacterota bacterium]
MFKKVVTGFLVLATSSLLAMSVSELNKASKAELMEVKGVGEKKADAIIEYRKANKFKTIKDVVNVKGVGPSLAEKIEQHKM